jgi:nucleotide-binding universal stress UspA family protein
MLVLNRILVARDFSEVSDHAVRYALDLAARTGATLHLVYAEVLHDNPFAEVRTRGAQQLDALKAKLRENAEGEPLFSSTRVADVHEAVVRDIAAGPAITHYADEHGIDLIVMGTHGRRGVARLLLGSVAEEVVRTAEQPVLTVPQTAPLGGADRILVPVDFSDYCRVATRYARGLAALYDARLEVVHVVEEDLQPSFYVGKRTAPPDAELTARAQEALQSFVAEAGGPALPADRVQLRVETGRAADCLLACAAEDDADLVVMSTHGLTGMERFLLGSVAEKVIRRAPCPVFVAKAFGKSLLPGDA